MTLKEFLQADELEQKIFISKMLYAVKRDEHYFLMADCIVENAALDGMFNTLKFCGEIKERSY